MSPSSRKNKANWSSFERKKNEPAPSSTSAPVARNIGEFMNQNSQNFRARLAQSQGSVEEGGNGTPACAKYGRNNSGVCRDGSTSCFRCGQNVHFMRECLKNRQENGNGGIESNLL
ncbi:hypothetical protein H5410_021380 [Solanum commersonii]|uniref:CCHC-type domain-containing protein n=1 Tax=Solanum commersonii TaxID=4109 RepID=A0A9J5ZAU3_SOLCO|nr:hypothetical protein H5410_021380 [Solanum commersonii]